MAKKNKKLPLRQQYGVVPYRYAASGSVEVLLVTTRETRRWMTPKGWPSKKLGPPAAALREAFEEAGVRGEAGPAVGEFLYLKIMRSPPHQMCRVKLFAMKVLEELSDWPEKDERDRRWFDPAEAAAAVEDEQLRDILLDLPGRLTKIGAAPEAVDS